MEDDWTPAQVSPFLREWPKLNSRIYRVPKGGKHSRRRRTPPTIATVISPDASSWASKREIVKNVLEEEEVYTMEELESEGRHNKENNGPTVILGNHVPKLAAPGTPGKISESVGSPRSSHEEESHMTGSSGGNSKHASLRNTNSIIQSASTESRNCMPTLSKSDGLKHFTKSSSAKKLTKTNSSKTLSRKSQEINQIDNEHHQSCPKSSVSEFDVFNIEGFSPRNTATAPPVLRGRVRYISEGVPSKRSSPVEQPGLPGTNGEGEEEGMEDYVSGGTDSTEQLVRTEGSQHRDWGPRQQGASQRSVHLSSTSINISSMLDETPAIGKDSTGMDTRLSKSERSKSSPPSKSSEKRGPGTRLSHSSSRKTETSKSKRSSANRSEAIQSENSPSGGKAVKVDSGQSSDGEIVREESERQSVNEERERRSEKDESERRSVNEERERRSEKDESERQSVNEESKRQSEKVKSRRKSLSTLSKSRGPPSNSRSSTKYSMRLINNHPIIELSTSNNVSSMFEDISALAQVSRGNEGSSSQSKSSKSKFFDSKQSPSSSSRAKHSRRSSEIKSKQIVTATSTSRSKELSTGVKVKSQHESLQKGSSKKTVSQKRSSCQSRRGGSRSSKNSGADSSTSISVDLNSETFNKNQYIGKLQKIIDRSSAEADWSAEEERKRLGELYCEILAVEPPLTDTYHERRQGTSVSSLSLSNCSHTSTSLEREVLQMAGSQREHPDCRGVQDPDKGSIDAEDLMVRLNNLDRNYETVTKRHVRKSVRGLITSKSRNFRYFGRRSNEYYQPRLHSSARTAPSLFRRGRIFSASNSYKSHYYMLPHRHQSNAPTHHLLTSAILDQLYRLERNTAVRSVQDSQLCTCSPQTVVNTTRRSNTVTGTQKLQLFSGLDETAGAVVQPNVTIHDQAVNYATNPVLSANMTITTPNINIIKPLPTLRTIDDALHATSNLPATEPATNPASTTNNSSTGSISDQENVLQNEESPQSVDKTRNPELKYSSPTSSLVLEVEPSSSVSKSRKLWRKAYVTITASGSMLRKLEQLRAAGKAEMEGIEPPAQLLPGLAEDNISTMGTREATKRCANLLVQFKEKKKRNSDKRLEKKRRGNLKRRDTLNNGMGHAGLRLCFRKWSILLASAMTHYKIIV